VPNIYIKVAGLPYCAEEDWDYPWPEVLAALERIVRPYGAAGSAGVPTFRPRRGTAPSGSRSGCPHALHVFSPDDLRLVPERRCGAPTGVARTISGVNSLQGSSPRNEQAFVPPLARRTAAGSLRSLPAMWGLTNNVRQIEQREAIEIGIIGVETSRHPITSPRERRATERVRVDHLPRARRSSTAPGRSRASSGSLRHPLRRGCVGTSTKTDIRVEQRPRAMRTSRCMPGQHTRNERV